MALQLTIGETTFTGQMKLATARISEREDGKANDLRIKINRNAGEPKPRETAEIVLKDGDRVLFGGHITNITPVEQGIGERFTDSIEAISYTYIPANKQVARAFRDWSAGDILKELIRDVVDPAYGLNTDNVDDGPVLAQISFNHISLKQALEKLASETGYTWWIDYSKNLYFKPGRDELAPEAFTDESGNLSGVDVETESTQIKNVVTVIGAVDPARAEESQTTITDVIVGDGATRKFSLKANPRTLVSVKRDGVAVPFGFDPIQDEQGNVLMFHFMEATVRVVDDEPALAEGEELALEYTYSIPVAYKSEDHESIEALAVLDGGDGRYEDVIVDRSRRTTESARLRAKRETDDFGNPLILITVETNSELLGEDQAFHAGQLVEAQFPSWGLNELRQYRLRELSVEVIETGDGVLYNYVMKLGGRLLGTREFLEALAEQQIIQEIEADEVERIINTLDRAEIEDHHEHHIITPPWKYEDDPENTHPVKARYGLAEYA